MNIEYIQNEIISLREELKSHRLYQQLQTLEDIKIFTQDHVFAVWDYIADNISKHKLEKALS
tara:strand:- start:856 stop:1041 length:186 start_codon:yes stop_codon:yes gene_type:complete